ncbi:hypothetical protein BDAP_002785 [Binucleata daphniae]
MYLVYVKSILGCCNQQSDASIDNANNSDNETEDSVSSLVDGINEYRKQENKDAFTEDPKLDAAAEVQAKHMAEVKQCTHAGPPGEEDFTTRLQNQGLGSCSGVENCAATHENPDTALDQWKKSPAHNRNLLFNGDKVGIASSKGDDDMNYVTMVATAK